MHSRLPIALSLTALLVLPGALHAVRPAPTATPEAAPKGDTAATGAAPAAPYVLKNKSQFNNPGDTVRVPFWPVGWSKQKGSPLVPVTMDSKFALDEKSFRVTSILIGSGTTPSLAVINGRAYSEGELIRMPRGSQAIRIRVQRINDGSVTLEHDEQKAVVPLRRPELNQHKDDDLLDPNR